MATFTVSPRDEHGAKPKHLRRKGIVPMAIIDRGHHTQMVQASIGDLREAFGSTDSHGMIDVRIEGAKDGFKAIVKSVDSDPIAHQILSVTLQEVAEGDTINATLPVVAKGHNDEMDGAALVLTAVTTELKVRGEVANLPESIEVDVSHLGAGEHINAGDVKLPSGVDLVTSPDAVLFTVSFVAAPVLEAEVPTEEEIAEVPTEE